MTKQKLISFITKKESYKELKPTITDISKESPEAIKSSIAAVSEILTNQYNAESKLYALRFLKDCFQAGSKHFIKLTSENILPVIANIVVESTDQQAITKYAGSSFTKSTDLEKFKSIMVSFFKLAKQCVMKWAEWVSNPEFKYAAAYASLVKKGVRFDNDFKYFRPQNEANFQKNCRINNFPLIVQSKQLSSKINDSKLTTQKRPSQNGPQSPRNVSFTDPQQKPAVSEPFQLSKRYGPKSKNKYILKCHQIFQAYDQKLKSGSMKETELQDMNNQVNSQLQEYMGLPDLNQTQMESELTGIFENIKNVKEDFAKMKTFNAKAKNQTSELKDKKSTFAKTQNVTEKKKIQTPQSPINQLTASGSQSPRSKFEPTPTKQSERQLKNQKPEPASIKKVESPKVNRQPNLETKVEKKVQKIEKVQKVEKKKIEIFEDDTSIIDSEIRHPKNIEKQSKKSVEVKSPKEQKTLNEIQKESKHSVEVKPPSKKEVVNSQKESKNSAVSGNSKAPSDKKIIQPPQPIKESKSPKNQDTVPIQKSLTKITPKSGSARENFDSNFEISRTQSSRVEFSESSADQESNDEGSRLTGNFRKQKNDTRLSSIIEDNREHIENSSRRNFNESQLESPKRQIRPKDMVVEKLSLNPNQIKVQKKAIDEYENKIKALEHHLREKQTRERELQKRLTELNTMKKIQENQLQKIRDQNNKILERFSNAVDPEEYGRIKRDFEQMKLRNKKMEGNMDRLNKQIQELKIIQRQHNGLSAGYQNKQNNIKMMPEPNKLFQDSQNMSVNSSYKKMSEPEKPKYVYQPLDPDYVKNRTHLSKLHEFLDENNLMLLKRNIIGAGDLFFNSEEMSFICRISPFKNENMALKLDLSFKFNGMNKKDVKPTINISNLEQIQVWKKNITGEEFLYHQQIVVKLKNFPFKLLKMEVSTSEQNKKSVVLPFVYFTFLKKCEIDQDRFDIYFSENKDSAIKSKVFNLNTKVVKDFRSLHLYQGFSIFGENRICFRMFEKSQKSSFWCEITNLSKQKCVIKVIPEPYNEEMYNKAQQLIQNLIFLIGGN